MSVPDGAWPEDHDANPNRDHEDDFMLNWPADLPPHARRWTRRDDLLVLEVVVKRRRHRLREILHARNRR